MAILGTIVFTLAEFGLASFALSYSVTQFMQRNTSILPCFIFVAFALWMGYKMNSMSGLIVEVEDDTNGES